MNTVIKKIVAHTYKPVLEKYLSKTRRYRHGNIRLEIPPEVFHPGFFYSTRLLLNHVLKSSLKNIKLLELGAGSGLIAISAAQKGAIVTATDINPVAIEFLERNGRENKVKLQIIRSDLFQDIPAQQFDRIVINPPYYRKSPKTWKEHAWFCGENGEYFSKLLQQLPAYIHPGSAVLMILCDGCDREMISRMAAENSLQMDCVVTKQTFIEKNFIYTLTLIH